MLLAIWVLSVHWCLFARSWADEAKWKRAVVYRENFATEAECQKAREPRLLKVISADDVKPGSYGTVCEQEGEALNSDTKKALPLAEQRQRPEHRPAKADAYVKYSSL